MARLLGPRGRGELAAIQTWPTFIGYLALLGTGDASVYHSARDPERAATYLGSAIVMHLLTAGPFMLVAFIALPWLLSAQSLAVVAGARWYLLIVPVLGMAGLPFYPLRGRGDFAAWNALRVTPTAVWMAILIMAWAVSCHRPSLLAYIYLGMLSRTALPARVLGRQEAIAGELPSRQRKLRSIVTLWIALCNDHSASGAQSAYGPDADGSLPAARRAWPLCRRGGL